MNEQRHEKTRPSHSSFMSLFIFTSLKIMLISAFAWLALLIWFIGTTFYKGPVQAVDSAQLIVANNMQFIQKNPAILTEALLNYFNNIQSGLKDLLAKANNWNISWLQSSIHILLVITEIQLTRLFIFILAFPLFILTIIVFITDGLVKRDIRKFQGARESTLIFHRIKGLTGVCFFVPFFIYLALPIAITPIAILIPQMLLFGSITALSITYFKKYL